MKLNSVEVILAKDFLTVREVAYVLDCSVRTVYRLIKNDTLKGINLCTRMTRIQRAELGKLIEY